MEKQQREYEERSKLSIQVALEEIVIPMDDKSYVAKYFCEEWTNMTFYSNPFLGEPTNPKSGNYLLYKLGCEVFEFKDMEKPEKD